MMAGALIAAIVVGAVTLIAWAEDQWPLGD